MLNIHVSRKSSVTKVRVSRKFLLGRACSKKNRAVSSEPFASSQLFLLPWVLCYGYDDYDYDCDYDYEYEYEYEYHYYYYHYY